LPLKQPPDVRVEKVVALQRHTPGYAPREHPHINPLSFKGIALRVFVFHLLPDVRHEIVFTQNAAVL